MRRTGTRQTADVWRQLGTFLEAKVREHRARQDQMFANHGVRYGGYYLVAPLACWERGEPVEVPSFVAASALELARPGRVHPKAYRIYPHGRIEPVGE